MINSHSETNGVNGHGNGVLPTKMNAPVKPSHDSQPVFVDLDDCNVGFKHWHPTPVIQHGDRLAGHGELGGVWEWTSSTLERHEGFEAMKIYPGYTCTFYLKRFMLPVETNANVTLKPTSSMESTISFLAGPGPLTPGLRGGRHCKLFSFWPCTLLTLG